MQRGWVIGGVFLASALVLAWNAGSAGPATAWVDPVAKVQAQDETVYAATSLGMATGVAGHGIDGWLTPKLLGRYALYKPPLLYWLSAISIKLFGFRMLAVRLPSLLAGAGVCALVFAWVWTESNVLAAGIAALLLLSSHLFFLLSRTALTDMLLTFWIVLAMYVLARDPTLDRRSILGTFGAAAGAAIMTKALAGLLPLLVLAVCCVLPKDRVRVRKWLVTAAIAAAVALPWHLYQLWMHPHWFWAEYVLTEMLAWGTAAPSQTTTESSLGFYALRAWALDPVLLITGLSALVRVRSRTLLVWSALVCAEVLTFQYRNAAYLLPLYPALAVMAACAVPVRYRRAQLAALLVAVVLFIAKAALPAQTFGLPFTPESVNPSYAALDAYAAMHRGNELILVDPDDQFYSALLHLPRVRYTYLDPRPDRPPLPLDFEYLGATVTEPEFERLSDLAPAFAAHLREFDLAVASADVAPIGSVILAKDENEIGDLLRSHPDSDFYIPERWAARNQAVHDAYKGHDDRVFLLSRKVIQRP